MTYIPDFPAAEATVRATLAESPFPEVAASLEAGGITRKRMAGLVAAIAAHGFQASEWAALEACCRNDGLADDPLLLPRYVLLAAIARNLPRVAHAPVPEEVKGRYLDHFLYVCAPDRETDTLLNPPHYGFRVMCRLVEMQRFPGGQFDWEIAGFARSWLTRVPRRDVAGLAWTVWAKAGGIRPYFAIHTGFRRELPIITPEAEFHGMRLLAECMERQPGIKAVTGSSWMLDPQLPSVSPQFRWMIEWGRETRRFGAFGSTVGPAPPDSGYLVGDRRRRRLYESGEWKPVNGFFIWPRKGLLRWLHEIAEPRGY